MFKCNCLTCICNRKRREEKRIREHKWRKLKIMYKEMGLALYLDLY